MHPSESATIKTESEKEIRINEAREKLVSLLEKENPSSFNMRWIRKQDRYLSGLMERNCTETVNKKKDYSKFIATLSPEWADKFRHFKKNVEKDRTFESCVQEVINKAEELKPDQITPGWIGLNCSSRYFFQTSLRLPNGDIAWDIIPDFLPSELRAIWHNDSRRMHHKDLFEMGKELEKKLKALNPETINTRWIHLHASDVHSWGQRYLKKKKGIDFRRLVNTLPEEQRLKFRWPGLLRFTKEITEKLNSLNPETFNAQWIKDNAPALHARVIKNYRHPADNSPDWPLIVACLPKEWQEKWRQGLREESRRKIAEEQRKYSFETAMEKLNQILHQNNPRIISSKTIENLAPDIYDHLYLYVRDNEGNIDWDRIAENLSEDLRQKFVKPKKLSQLLPREQYEDPKEVDAVLNNGYRSKLYTLLSASSKEEREWREKIYRELITLARSGNITAEDKIISYVGILANNWVDQNKELSPYKIAAEEIDITIRKCIYFYNETERSSFIGYINTTLKKKVLRLRKEVKEIELNKPLGELSSESLIDIFRT